MSIIQKRCDFVLFFDVQDGNPNGDPDAGNLPRIDPETGQGLVTDVCLKRKVRNYVLLAKNDAAPNEIYVKESSVLNQQQERGYKAKKIELATPVKEPVLPDLFKDPSSAELPEGFGIEEAESDATPPPMPQFIASYDGNLDKDELKAALKTIKEQHGNQAEAFFKALARRTKSRKASAEERNDVRQWMCDNFFDIRCFGAVMSTKTANAGQVRGPVQLTFARSVDPIVTLEHTISRVAVTNEEISEKQSGLNQTLGRKATVPYGLYRAHGFVSPALAERVEGRRVQGTGFSEDDLVLLWKALESMFEHDRSAARGLMSTRALVIFEHGSKLGEQPAHALFARVSAKKRKPDEPARCFEDYALTLDEKPLVGVRHLVQIQSTEG